MPPEHSRFKPGQSGNPGGWSASFSARTALRRDLAKGADKDPDGIGAGAVATAEMLVEAMRAGDAEKVLAICRVIAEAEGKPKEFVEHTGDMTVRRVILEDGEPSPS